VGAREVADTSVTAVVGASVEASVGNVDADVVGSRVEVEEVVDGARVEVAVDDSSVIEVEGYSVDALVEDVVGSPVDVDADVVGSSLGDTVGGVVVQHVGRSQSGSCSTPPESVASCHSSRSRAPSWFSSMASSSSSG
jgi:hypothetical protein